MDYRDILRRYMAHVYQMEGNTFVDERVLFGRGYFRQFLEDCFSPEEILELETISVEIRHKSGGSRANLLTSG